MSQLRITLCEYASANADGTYTVIRGGLTYWRGEVPVPIKAVLFIEVPPRTLAAGEHVLTIEVRESDALVHSMFGKIGVVAESVLYFAFPIELVAKHFGDLAVILRIGGLEARAVLKIEPLAN